MSNYTASKKGRWENEITDVALKDWNTKRNNQLPVLVSSIKVKGKRKERTTFNSCKSSPH